MRQIRAIAQKEVYHILRDFRSLIIIFVMPIMMTFLYGYAINMDIEHIALSVIDQDQTAESRDFVEQFYESRYFFRPGEGAGVFDAAQPLRASHAAAVLIIRPGFAEALQNGTDYELGLEVDGSEVSQAAAVVAYSNALLLKF